MILQSLVKYYEILTEDQNSDIPKLGYCKAKVSLALNISAEGELLELIPTKVKSGKGNKLLPQVMEVPAQEKRSSGIKPYFLCDNSSYVLGIDDEDNHDRAKKRFEAFKSLHFKILEGVDCDEAKAVLSFLDKWDIESARDHPALIEDLEEITSGVNIVFRLDGKGYIHKNSTIKRSWEKYKLSCTKGKVGQCLVSGERGNIARIHSNIKGVRGSKSVGAALVSFNAKAYESYGKDDAQGLNAPVSEYAEFAYTTVLNYLLADNDHKQYLGDTTIVFWAESPEVKYKDLASLLIDPKELETVDSENAKYKRDEGAVREVKEVFRKISQGMKIVDLSNEFDKNINFYILGLSPNSARLSVRFFLRDSFGGFIEKVTQHYIDMKIEKQFDTDPDVIPIWRILYETVSTKSEDKSASPLLAGSVLRSILNGSVYPTALFNAIMIRIRAEAEINYCKAAIIKAYLLRKYKESENIKEVLTVSLNEQSKNRAYVLGRLFAVLEKAQLEASEGNLNTTIRDRYFSSACATPARVFPILLKLAQYHISKAEYGYVNDKKIEQIMDMLDIEKNPFPAHLSLEEQGLFALGYYHQRKSNYTK
ncbi:MAG TPA: type I-C CRISPR-associated protein Cas8c/Csd1 [Clostridiaceae bacterium]|nr:type I-C CRISPR-associated protein Cas8c/Csd1 [Clostridiaceae bacterium]